MKRVTQTGRNKTHEGKIGRGFKEKVEKQNNAWAVHRNIDRELTGEEDMFLWLSKGDLKAETESEIVAVQDQVLQTKYYATKILNTETDSKCRLCQQFDETIDHIVRISMPNTGRRTIHKKT
jgi:hypothetical protein